MYDLELSQAGMRGSDPPAVAARRGVFQLWSDAGEVGPLFAYIKASQATAHPLDMAGFDMQVTADHSMDRFASDLGAFLLPLQQPGMRREMTRLADQALAARAHLFSSNFADQAELKTLDGAAGQLLAGIGDNRGAFGKIHDARSIAWMEHAIENMRVDAQNRYDAKHSIGPEVARENRRDARNFENLRWLIKEDHPGRKFIVWAHNVHVMKSCYSSDFRMVHVDCQANDMKPAGALLADWLGEQVYTIGMTTFQGRDALVNGGPATIINPPATGSLESYLHALGQPFVFLDLRSGGPPIHAPLTARIPKYESVAVPDIGRVYDGIFYIDQMTAATKLP